MSHKAYGKILAVENSKKVHCTNIKRFNVPGSKVVAQCPNCDSVCKLEFNSEYLSYPVINGEIDLSFHCEKCGDNHDEEIFYAKVVLRVFLEEAER